MSRGWNSVPGSNSKVARPSTIRARWRVYLVKNDVTDATDEVLQAFANEIGVPLRKVRRALYT